MVPPPPIQGVGDTAGTTMQLELRDASFDLAKLQSIASAVEANATVITYCGARERNGAITRWMRDWVCEGAARQAVADTTCCLFSRLILGCGCGIIKPFRLQNAGKIQGRVCGRRSTT